MIASPHAGNGVEGAWVVELTPITQPLTASGALHKVLSQVRHDIRSPLTSIKGAAELLLSGRIGAPDAPQRRMLGIIEEGVRRVNDVLDRTKSHQFDAGEASAAGIGE
jgi:signal transduction histidine kinase